MADNDDETDYRLDIAWDPVKAITNLGKHRITFEQAASVFNDPLALTVFDENHSDDEDRWFTLGMNAQGKLIAVSHTYTSGSPNRTLIRIISARPPTTHEQRQYEYEPR